MSDETPAEQGHHIARLEGEASILESDAASTRRPPPGRVRQFYDLVAPFLVILIGIAAAAGIWVGAAATITNGRQDEANAKLLGCLNSYAALSSTGNRLIRDATVARDVATVNRDEALDVEGAAFLRFVLDLRAGKVTSAAQLDDLIDSLRGRAAAASALEEAQAHLDQVRRNNPVPDPPAVFCDVNIDSKGVPTQK